jgi:hypothetical protein
VVVVRLAQRVTKNRQLFHAETPAKKHLKRTTAQDKCRPPAPLLVASGTPSLWHGNAL